MSKLKMAAKQSEIYFEFTWSKLFFLTFSWGMNCLLTVLQSSSHVVTNHLTVILQHKVV